MYRRTKYISDRIVVNIFQNNSGIRLKSNPSSKVKITNIVYYFYSYNGRKLARGSGEEHFRTPFLFEQDVSIAFWLRVALSKLLSVVECLFDSEVRLGALICLS